MDEGDSIHARSPAGSALKHVRHVCALGLFLLVSACSSSAALEPSPLPDTPALNCPADLSVSAHSDQTPTVSFDAPTAVKGAPPVSVLCSPASGSQFENGVTSVTCEATDSRQRKSSCTFSVMVTPVPQLLKTTFMAFGDSLTEGKTLTGKGAVEVPGGIVVFSPSYVEQLYAELTQRYQDQSIRIIAEGLGGRFTGDDKFRLPPILSQYKPDAVLLLEGTNDMLNFPDLPGINSATEALQKMVRDAKGAGARVFIGTLPQVIPSAPHSRASPAAASAILALNARIRSIAQAENVVLADMYNAVPDTDVGDDGVHLTPDGYVVMADEWMKAIVDTLEVKSSAPQGMSARARERR
jgi:lysophospholipase L1-like esterase